MPPNTPKNIGIHGTNGITKGEVIAVAMLVKLINIVALTLIPTSAFFPSFI